MHLILPRSNKLLQQKEEEREGKTIVLTDVKKNRNTGLKIIFQNGYLQKYCFPFHRN